VPKKLINNANNIIDGSATNLANEFAIQFY